MATSITSVSAEAKKWSPVFVYHSQESYFAYSIKEWIKTTERKDGKHFFPKDVRGEPKPHDFVDYKDSVHSFVDERVHADGTTTISYYLFFAYNGSKRIAGVAPTGAHEADMEEVHVHLKADKSLAYILLSTHGDSHVYNLDKSLQNDSKYNWNSKAMLELNDYGHPIVYVARNSHALYGSAGSFVRFGGFGNDETSKSERIVALELESLNSDENAEIKAYSGKLGADGVSGFPARTIEGGFPELSRAKRMIKHFTKIHPSLLKLGYLAYLVAPVVLLITLNKKLGFYSILIALGVVYLQPLMIKTIFHFFGAKMGIDPDKDSALGWVFAFRL